jgi:hypothetical protein
MSRSEAYRMIRRRAIEGRFSFAGQPAVQRSLTRPDLRREAEKVHPTGRLEILISL